MRKIIFFLFIIFCVISCASIDCPLENRVTMSCQLMGEYNKLKDTLTISTTRTDNNDTVLLNKALGIDKFVLPLSYAQAEDMLFFKLANTEGKIFLDTVRITKDNKPHFESIDCPPAIFHHITKAACTNHALDSVVINHKNVNYDATKTHIYLYFKNHLY